MQLEPKLQPVMGESLPGSSANTAQGARTDISINGLCGGSHGKSYVDIRVFNPHAASNNCTSMGKCYCKHEKEKKRQYEARIREVEQQSVWFL